MGNQQTQRVDASLASSTEKLTLRGWYDYGTREQPPDGEETLEWEGLMFVPEVLARGEEGPRTMPARWRVLASTNSEMQAARYFRISVYLQAQECRARMNRQTVPTTQAEVHTLEVIEPEEAQAWRILGQLVLKGNVLL